MVLSSCFVTIFGRCNVYLRCSYSITYIYVFVKLHTQRNNVFIRFIILSVWACSIGHVAQAVQRPAPCPIVPVQCVQRLGVCAPCLAWSVLLPVLCSRSGCAGVGRGAPAGYTAAAQPRPVSPVTTEKIKKAQKITLPPIANLKNFPQKQKDPYKGSVFCAILALQALKGRNL